MILVNLLFNRPLKFNSTYKQIIMKRNKERLLFSLMALMLSGTLFMACSKSSTTSTVTPPTPLGGYISSDAVASANLIAYWPFDGNSNDAKGGLTATSVGVSYTTGIRGQAYQGTTGSYDSLGLPASNSFSSLTSYSFSVWYKLPAQQPSGDPGGVFFLSGLANQAEMIYEVEHNYSPTGGADSIRIHHGFTDLGSPAYQGFTMESYDTTAFNSWVHWVTTYDGTSSTWTVYENGIAIGNSSAFSSGMYINPTHLWTDGTMTTPLGNISFAPDPPKYIIIGTWPSGLYGVSSSLGANGSFIGSLDELRIFNKALSASEVNGLYLNGKAGR